MALREIVTVGDPILRKISKPVTQINDKIHTLLDDMIETMRFENRGVGLAAVQVGMLKRIFICDVGEDSGLIEFINPEMLSREGSVLSTEGCLSVPDRSGVVERPERIKIRALDRFGKSFELDAEGFLAVCICHEYDHLEGVLFIDKLTEGPKSL